MQWLANNFCKLMYNSDLQFQDKKRTDSSTIHLVTFNVNFIRRAQKRLFWHFWQAKTLITNIHHWIIGKYSGCYESILKSDLDIKHETSVRVNWKNTLCSSISSTLAISNNLSRHFEVQERERAIFQLLDLEYFYNRPLNLLLSIDSNIYDQGKLY